jgi:hypothetical protein
LLFKHSIIGTYSLISIETKIWLAHLQCRSPAAGSACKRQGTGRRSPSPGELGNRARDVQCRLVASLSAFAPLLRAAATHDNKVQMMQIFE